MPFKTLSDATGEELYALQQAGLLWWVSAEDGGSLHGVQTTYCEPDGLTLEYFSDVQKRRSLFGLLLED